MAGRSFVATIDNVSIGTAVQDIFSIKSAAGIGLVLEAIHLDSTNTAIAALRMRLRRATATVTQGSGGTNQTPGAIHSKDQGNHAATYHINDTTQATTTGAFYNIGMFNWDTVGPFDYIPTQDDTKPDCLASEALILDLPATITATTVSGYMIIREVP